MPRALITGISGQDGSYLSELLLDKGYEVHGVVRRSAIENPHHELWRLPRESLDQITLHVGDLESYPSLQSCVRKSQPDEIYHLAACSFVSYSMEEEFSTLNVNLTGTHHLLSAIKQWAPESRFYFAGSSEMFGNAIQSPQNEQTPFNPRSVYGISKLAGFHLVRNFRERHGLKTSTGILFNHESPRRGFQFVTRKITSYAARIKLGLADSLELGNLDAERDWGHSRDYVKAMWMMLQESEPDDYVVATGVSRTVRMFCEKAFARVGLDYREFVKTNDSLFRVAETTPLLGDATKAKENLGWEAESCFDEMVVEMVDSDLAALSK
ncbi:MAG: GDP-mannose 4,6-dehydratase [Opitutae bacterium]|jgi:GDPmannose 4,6-dehydratase|nr:GDP-mannose 4,6-dehydratase [Opitutae bacterium]|tara:strand:- start:22088 stop:23062 length:975 start_codon:yes stop_codon:yes gene_type:complete